MKESIKKLLRLLPFALSKNHAYDLQTKQVIRKVCKENSNCIDVGCHKGEIMDIFLTYAPNGRHLGIEPLPHFCKQLREKYNSFPNVHIYDCALSNTSGVSSFNYVITNPAYSGIKRRKYDRSNEKDTTIHVNTLLLDDLAEDRYKIDLIKIDVEGGEYQVLQGAVSCIKRDKPVIVFEHGKGASDVYGTEPENIFDFFVQMGYNIFTMEAWLKNSAPFSKSAFTDEFHEGRNYYFLACSVDRQVN